MLRLPIHVACPEFLPLCQVVEKLWQTQPTPAVNSASFICLTTFSFPVCVRGAVMDYRDSLPAETAHFREKCPKPSAGRLVFCPASHIHAARPVRVRVSRKMWVTKMMMVLNAGELASIQGSGGVQAENGSSNKNRTWELGPGLCCGCVLALPPPSAEGSGVLVSQGNDSIISSPARLSWLFLKCLCDSL